MYIDRVTQCLTQCIVVERGHPISGYSSSSALAPTTLSSVRSLECPDQVFFRALELCPLPPNFPPQPCSPPRCSSPLPHPRSSQWQQAASRPAELPQTKQR